MTVQIDWGEQVVNMRVHGDIYEEQAECLRDMALSHVRRGIRELDIKLCATYYISCEGRKRLEGMRAAIESKGVHVSVRSQCSCISCLNKLQSKKPEPLQ